MRWLSVLLLVVGWAAPSHVSASEGATYGIEEFRAHLAASERAIEAWPACRAQAGPAMEHTPECRRYGKADLVRDRYSDVFWEYGHDRAKEELLGNRLITEAEWQNAMRIDSEVKRASRKYLDLKNHYDDDPPPLVPPAPYRGTKFYNWNDFHLHKLALEASIAAWKSCKPPGRKNYFGVSPHECRDFIATWETVNAFNRVLWTGKILEASRTEVRSGPITDAGLAEIAELNAEYLDALFIYARAVSEQIKRRDKAERIFEFMESLE